MNRLPNPKKFVSERKKEIMSSKVDEELTDSEKAQIAEDILKAVEKDTDVKFKGVKHHENDHLVILKIGNGLIHIRYKPSDGIGICLRFPECHELPYGNSQGNQFTRDRIKILSYYIDNYEKSNLKKVVSKI